MSTGVDNNSPHIADILATIRKMTAEKSERESGSGSKKFSTQRAEPLRDSKAPNFKSLAPNTPASSTGDDDVRAPMGHTKRQPTRDGRSSIPYTKMPPNQVAQPIASMLDNRFTGLSEKAAKAWPGLNSGGSHSRTAGKRYAQSAFCSGPILASTPKPSETTSQTSPIPSCLRGLPDITAPRSSTGAAPKATSTDASFDDAAAQLLRPLIMEWVDTNMRDLVEGALTLESAVKK